ncbi:MAG: uracil-DNA glycosylase family protein [Sphaerochaetaceae bacterium]
MSAFSDALIERTKQFSREVEAIAFTFDGYIYNPLNYAFAPHSIYLRRFVHQNVDVYFLGMNPGPFGMVQTGVPFGEVEAVTQWMGISSEVGHPPSEHPQRPVVGFAIKRSEISGKRLWSLMKDRYGTAEHFFQHHAVMNYCPLVFVDKGKTGRNIIPEKLAKGEKEELERICNAYLDDTLTLIKPKALVGIGRYAQKQLSKAAQRLNLTQEVFSILHPSPGSPLANAGWDTKVIAQMEEASLW